MNWRWKEGMSTSVQAGLAALPPKVEAAVFLLCDQPLITPEHLHLMVDSYHKTSSRIVFSSHAGQRSSPTLFDRSLFEELASVKGDQGGRALIQQHSQEAVAAEMTSPEMLSDIDTIEDYERLREASFGKLANGLSTTSIPNRIRHLIIDMDGVLWRGEQPIEGLVAFFEMTKEREIGYVLATNNASRTPESYVQKLRKFGVDIPAQCILTSAQAAASYLSDQAPPGAPVYVLGMEGLREAVLERGFHVVEGGAEYVVVGWTIDLSWQQLAAATIQIRQGAQFIGTNPDVTFPSEVGLVPGNGAVLAALEAATNVQPIVVGKPRPHLYQEAMRQMASNPRNTAVIGDRLDTDIAGGAELGLFTILVLSGITTSDDQDSWPLMPDLVCNNIGELSRLWAEGQE
jgi:4-nitrophenyl phosphatase